MTFLIDGYNLMHAVGLVSRATPSAHFERARTRFLDWLADGVKGRAATLRVVFDAQDAPAPSLEMTHRGVRVRFAYQRTADDVIEDLVAVEQKPHAVTVVSNDSRVREAARRADCGVASCQEFTDWLISDRAPGASASSAPEPDKPEPTADDLDELLQIFSKPKSKP
ncbi:NYN domain-containing protein [Gemmata sp. G18]|uniref:NYN domain-containing protein n=1 Tax=Gemmata palustris TaxID=2822762 RepID=A0ABS5C1L1_9BACT|nr:NYN domain-containing protein [Gemmata palustris]MBP3959760.1 NYN domain-containing protein [Gemmata palustris]